MISIAPNGTARSFQPPIVKPVLSALSSENVDQLNVACLVAMSSIKCTRKGRPVERLT